MDRLPVPEPCHKPGCSGCGGSGKADQIYDDAEIGEYVIEQECPECDGTGTQEGAQRMRTGRLETR